MSAAAGEATAQRKTLLNPETEPFSIKSGSTFSASGGASVTSRAAETSARLARIADDIREAEGIIGRNHLSGRIDPAEQTRAAVGGALRSLDPHSNFFDAAQWKDLMDEEQSGYIGIGATIASFEKSGTTDVYILSTFPDSPAARAQLRFGDRIVAIDGESMGGKDADIVRDKLRGPAGTPFRLTVERAATNRPETFEIRRHRVSQPSIPDTYMLRPGVPTSSFPKGLTTRRPTNSTRRCLN